jgi:hypothetical protein
METSDHDETPNFWKERWEQGKRGTRKLEEADFATFPLQLADSVEESLLATSLWSDDPLKSSNRSEYLERLATAVRTRGVEVRRLFIISPDDEATEIFKKRLEHDKVRGFTSRFMTADQWIKSKHVPKPIDFGVWDKRVVWIYTGDKSSKRHKAKLWSVRLVVDAYSEAFQINWPQATEVP